MKTLPTTLSMLFLAASSGCAQAQTKSHANTISELEISEIREEEKICKTECGMSNVEIALKGFLVSEGNIATSKSRLPLDKYEQNELRRMISQRLIAERLSKNISPISATMYLEPAPNEEPSSWHVYDFSALNKYHIDYVSDDMITQIWKSAERLGHIAIQAETEDGVQSIKLLDSDWQYARVIKPYGKRLMEVKIPLFEFVGDVEESAVLYFSRRNHSRNCLNPNTHFIRRIQATSNIAKSLIRPAHSEEIIEGHFSVCAGIYEWTANMGPTKFNSINLARLKD